MKKEMAIKFAKEDCKEYNCDGFVVVKNGYDVEYDYILFSDYNELCRFITHLPSYDYLDSYCVLNTLYGEEVVYVYSKSHIVIL